MRKFWTFLDNGTYRVGCNGGTLYVYDQNNRELAKFKDLTYAYTGAFHPGKNLFALKSTGGGLAFYDLDEMRLCAGIRSANEIAAEYHAMADAGAISFSSVSSSDKTVPVLGIPSVAGSPEGAFTVSVEVSENTPASIVCIVGETEVAMTTSGASLPAIYTATFSQLVTAPASASA